ncbi:hypothetical protein [Leifsonia sp. Root112D2]|uniref:hypothetical protein n=1 Tax=Leifsonia sp. Root112D2 TaxID=1736426 RepID=UPI0006F5A8A9|nr:hypothetical protein [Leifsonia sp. Root112D2]KQV07161.1 hypothetical protein ASC63_07535 [Leifsonia sp. Root112D2]
MFDANRRDRVIADYDIGLPESWYQVDLEAAPGVVWARGLAQQLAATASARTSLTERLQAVHGSLVRIQDPSMTAAVWIRDPDSGRVDSVLGFRLTDLAEGQDEETYLAELAEDDGRIEPGTRYQAVQTWTVPVAAGLAVGAYNLISHTELGDEETQLEERTVIGVFPPHSTQFVECIFTAETPGTYEDIIQDTMKIAASISVELVKA